MATAPLCTIADVQVILSPFATTDRIDDDFDGSADTGLADSCIALVSTKVQRVLLGRYSLTSITSNQWVRWCTATLVAEFLCLRRANPVPASIAEDAKEYRDTLLQIGNMEADLFDDAGLPVAQASIPGSVSDLPAVSNMTIDGRFQRSKLRRIDSISTQLPANGMSNPAIDYYLLP